jgi:uncharacterized DUF497 family protein
MNYTVTTGDMSFEWDIDKASLNESKHGVSFMEAHSAFFDVDAKLIADPDHSYEEDRFVLLGISFEPRIILVCHCYRGDGEVVRIISARIATREESKIYKTGAH